MAKKITIEIDLSGRNRDSHGDVESTPKISVSSHGLDTAKESLMLGEIHNALIEILNPQPINA